MRTVAPLPSLLDHVVIAGDDLDALIDWFAGRTGVQATPGGRHPTGTANALVALSVDGRRGRHYIELVGPAPHVAHKPTTFGIDTLHGPAVVGYAIHPDDITAVADRARRAGVDLGDVQPLSRQRTDGTLLEWTLTEPRAGALPFLIDWGASPHPGLEDLPVIEAVSLTRHEPDPAALRERAQALGLPENALAGIEPGDPGYTLTLRTPRGEVTL